MQKDEKVHIVPYDPSWPAKFEEEKNLVEETLGKWIVGGVHHVGSTSIPGLSAKPIIDIMVGVSNLEKAKTCIPFLQRIHYYYFPYKPEHMIWFCKPSPEHRTHHLYLIEPTSYEWQARIAFRDYLRNHAEERQAYEELKRHLVEQFSDDREAYTKAKEGFVKSVVTKALSNSYK